MNYTLKLSVTKSIYIVQVHKKSYPIQPLLKKKRAPIKIQLHTVKISPSAIQFGLFWLFEFCSLFLSVCVCALGLDCRAYFLLLLWSIVCLSVFEFVSTCLPTIRREKARGEKETIEWQKWCACVSAWAPLFLINILLVGDQQALFSSIPLKAFLRHIETLLQISGTGPNTADFEPNWSKWQHGASCLTKWLKLFSSSRFIWFIWNAFKNVKL